MIKLKDILNEAPKKDLDYLYKGDKKSIEKGLKDVDYFLKAMSIDLGKAGHNKESVEFQRFYKKNWIEFKLKFEKMYSKVIKGK